jgi:hypothetical protein
VLDDSDFIALMPLPRQTIPSANLTSALRAGEDRCNIDLMGTYRIIPLGGAYRVEAIQPNGQKRIVRTWPAEEAAVSHLKALREVSERSSHTLHPGEKNWRG